MTDIVDERTRSRMMSGIRGKNTTPELLIRKALFKRRFRYRLHSTSLPGKPDLFFPKYHAIILVNGCFWHKHNCHLFKWPKTRSEFWEKKILENSRRDKANILIYKEMGYKVLVVWECAIKGKFKYDLNELIDRIVQWLVDGVDTHELSGYKQKE